MLVEQKIFQSLGFSPLGAVEYVAPSRPGQRSRSDRESGVPPNSGTATRIEHETVRSNTGEAYKVGETPRSNATLPALPATQQAGFGNFVGFLTNPLVLTLVVGGIAVTQYMKYRKKRTAARTKPKEKKKKKK